MKTRARSLPMLAACSLLALLAGCGGGATNTTSINLGGSVTGLTDSGLVLSNGLSVAAIGSNSTTFTFPSRVLIGSQYLVQVQTNPPSLLCTVTNGLGFVTNNTDINNVAVACVPRNTLGGTITGLATDGLILANGSDTVRPAPGAQSFTFATKIGKGFSYGVTVLQQPMGLICSIAGGTGVMGATALDTVQVTCR